MGPRAVQFGDCSHAPLVHTIKCVVEYEAKGHYTGGVCTWETDTRTWTLGSKLPDASGSDTPNFHLHLRGLMPERRSRTRGVYRLLGFFKIP